MLTVSNNFFIMGVICQGNTEPDNPKIQKQINKLIMHQEIMAYWS